MSGPRQPPDPAVAAEVRCPGCGAPVTWDPASKALRCESCGARTEVAAEPGAGTTHTLEEASHRWPDRPRRPGILRLQCAECGAVVEALPGALTARCAFCGSAEVAEAKDDGRSFPPDAVLPFTVSREAATAAYRRWLGGHWLRPGGLARRSHLERLTPVYVPFWAFSFGSHVDWGVDVGRERAEVDVGLIGASAGEMDWSRATGDLEHTRTDVLAQGSTGVPEALWRAIEPFPVGEATPYDPRFLEGFAAEHARLQPLQAWESVRDATEDLERAAVEDTLPIGRHRRLSMKLSYRDVAFQQVLLPIWVAAYRYRGDAYRFLVNGATGEVQGKLPVSRLRVAAVALVVLVALAGLLNAMGPAVVGAARHLGHVAEQALPGSHAPPPRMTPEERARAAGLTPASHATGPVHLRHFDERRHRSDGGPPQRGTSPPGGSGR